MLLQRQNVNVIVNVNQKFVSKLVRKRTNVL